MQDQHRSSQLPTTLLEVLSEDIVFAGVTYKVSGGHVRVTPSHQSIRPVLKGRLTVPYDQSALTATQKELVYPLLHEYIDKATNKVVPKSALRKELDRIVLHRCAMAYKRAFLAAETDLVSAKRKREEEEDKADDEFSRELAQLRKK